MASKEKRIEDLKAFASERKAVLKFKKDQLEKEQANIFEKYGIKDIAEAGDILDSLESQIEELDKKILKALDEIEAKIEEADND